MPGPRSHPATYVAKNGRFPHGPYKGSTPHEVYLAGGLAIRLRAKIGDESIRYIAKTANLSPQTIFNILNGTTWPDLRTIAKLERTLGAKLWGSEHRKTPFWRDSHRYLH